MGIALKIRRAETPFYASLKRLALALLRFEIPGTGILVPVLRAIHLIHGLTVTACRRLLVVFYRAPLFRSYCVSVGRNLYLEQLPSISGQTRVTVGDDVFISGSLAIASSHVLDDPELTIGNRVFIGHRVTIHAHRQVILEDGALIASDCYISDSDEHPRERDLRAKGLPARPEEILPIRICRDAWIGKGSYILKGVTVGEGALVGAGSVVLNDVPPFCVAIGNPARVVQRLPQA